MQYFSYIAYNYTLNNNLEKALHEFLEAKNRMVIVEMDIHSFKENIIMEMNEICKRFPRCKPIIGSWHQYSHQGDMLLSGIRFCNFYIYKSKCPQP